MARSRPLKHIPTDELKRPGRVLLSQYIPTAELKRPGRVRLSQWNTVIRIITLYFSSRPGITSPVLARELFPIYCYSLPVTPSASYPGRHLSSAVVIGT